MTRTSRRPRLGVQTLERRDTPAGFGPAATPVIDAVRSPDVVRYGSITADHGVITATGTDYADVIRVENFVPVVSAKQGIVEGDTPPLSLQAVVTITDALGAVRKDAAGQPLRVFFSRFGNTVIVANALGGNDRIVNGTGKTTLMDGGPGNDTLTGGAGLDIMRGGAGNDVMDGGGAQDQMHGDAGYDLLLGGEGNDLVQGDGHNDTLRGGGGDDSLYGGDHNDLLYGGGGNDFLYGEADNDRLFGEGDRDRLFGGDGDDNLNGGTGDDGLFGGAGKDTLTGGTGIDRFLKWQAAGNTTAIADGKAVESASVFKDTTTVAVFPFDGVQLRYQPAAWTEEEIIRADGGLDFLHLEVGSTRMLKQANGADVTFLRFGTYVAYDAADGVNDANDLRANEAGVRFAGFNTGDGRVFFNDGTFNGSDHDVASVVIHELAHNWENENSRYAEWLALSGWVAGTDPAPGQTVSGDGEWLYNTGVEFQRDYGKTNPLEDFATSFQAYHDLHTGVLSASEMYRLTAKLNFIGLFVATLA